MNALSEGTYGRQVYVPDMPTLLTTIAPTLEERVADSLYAGLTGEVRINMCREGSP